MDEQEEKMKRKRILPIEIICQQYESTQNELNLIDNNVIIQTFFLNLINYDADSQGYFTVRKNEPFCIFFILLMSSNTCYSSSIIDIKKKRERNVRKKAEDV